MLSLAAVEALMKSRCIRLRTGVHPVVGWLNEKGIVFETFDLLYQKGENFQEVYRHIAREIISIGLERDVLYALPGHPLVAEESVDLIREEAARTGIPVEIIPGVSFLDALLCAIKLNPSRGLHVIDGLRLDEQPPDPAVDTVVIQAYSRMVLSDIKLNLMGYYPDEHPVIAVTAAGVPGEEEVERCLLYELDRIKKVNHLTSIYIPPAPGANQAKACRFPLDPLVMVMERLRGEDGCPWDREQNHQTLKRYLLEETYEVLEAIDRQDMYNICEELGDLLLQIVFHTQIAMEGGHFDVNDVVGAITKKLIRRHPHVFGGVKVENSSDVIVNWAAIKKKEKEGQAENGLFDGIPGCLPALMKAQKIQARAARVGFDWPDYRGAYEKVYEELDEMRGAIESGSSVRKEDEMGDILFAAVNLSRLLRIDAEVALIKAAGRFLQRFQHMENMASLSGRNLSDCSLDEMDAWWEEGKKVENNIK
jgi:tetrapyrrole methylase family protein/MazG family protein